MKGWWDGEGGVRGSRNPHSHSDPRKGVLRCSVLYARLGFGIYGVCLVNLCAFLCRRLVQIVSLLLNRGEREAQNK